MCEKFEEKSLRILTLCAFLFCIVGAGHASERWSFGTTKDQMTGDTSQYWANSPKETKRVGRKLVTSFISVRCAIGEEPHIYFAFSPPLKFDTTLGIVSARSKWDDGEVNKINLSAIHKPLLNITLDRLDWIGRMAEHNNLTVEFPVKGQPFPIYNYTLAEAAKAIAYVTSKCKKIP